ncbi:MAG: YciI family protein [Isosphaeraceae bacterium]|nr:YciI family protein [Isosphaeraceae bacterium]
MSKYMLIYRDPAEPAAAPSPEEMQAFLAMWGEWFGKFGPAIVDGGDALEPGGRMLQPGGIVSDGPYVEAKEVVGGYSVVEAESFEKAVEIARECPIAKVGGGIEIRKLAGYNA